MMAMRIVSSMMLLVTMPFIMRMVKVMMFTMIHVWCTLFVYGDTAIENGLKNARSSEEVDGLY